MRTPFSLLTDLKTSRTIQGTEFDRSLGKYLVYTSIRYRGLCTTGMNSEHVSPCEGANYVTKCLSLRINLKLSDVKFSSASPLTHIRS